jgi:integrase
VGSVTWRKRPGGRYQVSWRLDDGSQGAKTVATKDEALVLHAQKRLEIASGAWTGRQKGKLPFTRWDDEWWSMWSADPRRSPATLAAADNRRRRHLRPWFGERLIQAITPTTVRQWQAQLERRVGYDTVMACRSLLFRVLQLAEDEGAILANPVRKVRPPKREVDPDQVFGQVRRRALTPEEAGELLAQFPLFWWDHVVVLLGTGLRFGELAGLRRRRVDLDRAPPVLQVVDVRYQAGRFGSGFKPRPKSDAGIRELPLAPTVVTAVRRQLPPGDDPQALVFTGPGGGYHAKAGARTVLSAGNFRRLYQRAAARAEGLGHLDLRGPHDLRHTFATWLEDAGIPARVIDELMGHAGGRRAEHGSAIGRVYRETTPGMTARVVAVLEARLAVALRVAETLLERRDAGSVLPDEATGSG